MSAGRGGIVALLLALVAAGCSRGGWEPPSARADGATPVLDAVAAAAPVCEPASLEDRAGRVLIVGMPEVTTPDDPLVVEVHDVGVGGVLLTHANVVSEFQVAGLVRRLKSGSRGPLLVTVDEEPGRVRTFEQLWGYVPAARTLAYRMQPQGVQEVAKETGEQLADLGITLNFAPVADLDDGIWNGIVGDRSFSADPATAADYTLAYARGLQEAGVIPVVKHFPGHGRAADDSHVILPSVQAPLPVLRGTDVLPFSTLVQAGAPVVMMANVAYDALDPGIPASLSPKAYSLLRELGFRGVALTDSIGMGSVNLTWNYGDAAVEAIAAGADGVLATDGWGARWMRDDLVGAVRSGRLPESRLNEAASRMTALAGGDPLAFSCQPAALPQLR
ncbi:MAG TPA: glycoside hydrolase family 3 N-terminal domain-containing protein [Acidimicrobiales bacterium]